MSLFRSNKNRLRHLFETHAFFRPIGEFLRFLLAQKFKLSGLLHRFFIRTRLTLIRLRCGKKLIVIYRAVGIGDIVCTFPLVEELRRQNPDHHIVYVTSRHCRDFVAKFSAADTVITTAYSLYSLPLPQLPPWVATTALYPRYKGEWGNDFQGPRTGYVAEMASSFGITLSQPRPVIKVDKNAARSVLSRFAEKKSPRPYIGIHLGPTLPVREYPLESWQELVTRLNDELGATLFRFGSKVHHSFHGTGATDLVNVPYDFTDRLDLVESTELLSTMDLFIGIDSGLLHIANATGVPVIGLFGPTDPSIVLPSGTGTGLFSREMACIFCQHRDLKLHWNTGCPYDIQCMKQISVDSILLQVKAILETARLLPTRAP